MTAEEISNKLRELLELRGRLAQLQMIYDEKYHELYECLRRLARNEVNP